MTEDFTRAAGDPTLGQEAAAPGRPPVGPPPVAAPPPPGAPAPVTSAPAEQDTDAKESAKQEASKVAGTAKEDAAKVADTAKDEVRRTADDAKRQAQDLLRQGQSELSTQAATQQQRLASGLRSFSAEMNQMADGAEEPGTATHLARWASQTADDAGRWLEDRDPSSVLEEVQRYARRHPGTFMLIAAGLGLAAGRIARSLKDSNGEDQDGAGAPGGTSTGSPAGTPTGSPVGYSTGSPVRPAAGTPVPPPPGMTHGTTEGTGGLEQPGGVR